MRREVSAHRSCAGRTLEETHSRSTGASYGAAPARVSCSVEHHTAQSRDRCDAIFIEPLAQPVGQGLDCVKRRVGHARTAPSPSACAGSRCPPVGASQLKQRRTRMPSASGSFSLSCLFVLRLGRAGRQLWLSPCSWSSLVWAEPRGESVVEAPLMVP